MTRFVARSVIVLLLVAAAVGSSGSGVLATHAPVERAPADCFEEVEDCPNQLTPSSGDLPVTTIVVGAVFLGVFVFGLRAIKRQRDEGRRSKLPPIG